MKKKNNILILFIILLILLFIFIFIGSSQSLIKIKPTNSNLIIHEKFNNTNKFNPFLEKNNFLSILMNNTSLLLEKNYFNNLYFDYLNQFFTFNIKYYTINHDNNNNNNDNDNMNFSTIINKVNNFEYNFATIDEPLLYFYTYKIDNISNYSLINNILNKSYYKFIDYSNIRFITTLYNKYFLFISNKNLEIYNSYEIIKKKIGVLKHSNDLIYLKLYLFSKEKLDNEIYIYETEELIRDDYKNGLIDIIFICSTLNNTFLDLFKTDSFILDCLNDINDKLLSHFIPNVFKEKILINNFKYNKNKYINLISIRYFLISNVRVLEWVIYLFLHKYFNNLNYLKLNTEKINFNGNINLSKKYYIISKIKYHKGAKRFYKNKGFILF